jgi:hypothetical protein
MLAAATLIALPGYAETSAPLANGISLDEGLAQIARELEAGLPPESRIAVVNFNSPSARFSDYVLEELQGILTNGRTLIVVERSNLELLRNTVAFQMAGSMTDEDTASLGK